MPSSPTTVPEPANNVVVPRQPTNLLGTYFTYSSIVLLNTKGQSAARFGWVGKERKKHGKRPDGVGLGFSCEFLLFVFLCGLLDDESAGHGRLCLITLTCITEASMTGNGCGQWWWVWSVGLADSRL